MSETITKYRVTTDSGFSEFATLEEAQVFADFYDFADPEEIVEDLVEDPLAEVRRKAITRREFGNLLVTEFIAGDLSLGLEDETSPSEYEVFISGIMWNTFQALELGLLYDAIYQVKSIPVESYLSPYITAERLLVLVNRVEDHLGLPNSTDLTL